MKKGFGLIEVLVSGLIVISIVSAAAVLRQRSSSQASEVRHQEVAALLAQEGVEAVRQIRDTNYLTKQSGKMSTGFLVSMPWYCYLTTRTDVSSGSVKCNTADVSSTSAEIALSTNAGDFSTKSSSNAGTMELSTGMVMSKIFTDVSGNYQYLPSFGLSLPSISDTGDYYSNTPFSSRTRSNVDADACAGVERILVPEGTSATAYTILSNKRGDLTTNSLGTTGQQTQQNYITSISDNCSAEIPVGYVEFRRQISVTDISTISGGRLENYPTSWQVTSGSTTTVSTKKHIIKVLVRVSWTETNRLSVSGSENAVLFSTYLTDWRTK